MTVIDLPKLVITLFYFYIPDTSIDYVVYVVYVSILVPQ